VIQLRLMGETYADIAADVGICPATVGNYLKAAGMVRARG
jgi:predicted transcriptional regulator